MKLAVIRDTKPDEARVAASPDTVKKFKSLGFEVVVEKGAGMRAAVPDAAFEAAGAAIAHSAAEAVKSADVVLCVGAPDEALLSSLKEGAVVVGMFDPHRNADFLAACAKAKVSACSMELLPRITRAQGMDVLSSQANLAGYRAVIEAAHTFGRAFPMMMTAAGTIAPARVMVMGAGVAGLQAIATAKRLGAVVCATDVRPAAKEQVKSLGGDFVAVEDEEFKAAETATGYAKPMSPEYQAKQAELVASTIAKQDIVICTALIPGRKAPLLVTEDMVKSMKPGSVIVDMAVSQGGNCAVSQLGKTVIKHDVSVIGIANLPSRIAVDASALYARNLLAFLTPFVKDGAVSVNREDEIVTATLLTFGGAVVHPQFAKGE